MVKYRNFIMMDKVLKWFVEVLKMFLKEYVLGFVSLLVVRIWNEFIINILVKILKENFFLKIKGYILKV